MNWDLIYEIVDAEPELRACGYPSRFFATREAADRAVDAIRQVCPAWAAQEWIIRETNHAALVADCLAGCRGKDGTQ